MLTYIKKSKSEHEVPNISCTLCDVLKSTKQLNKMSWKSR